MQRFPTYGVKGRVAQSGGATSEKGRSTVTHRAHAELSDSFSSNCEESLVFDGGWTGWRTIL